MAYDLERLLETADKRLSGVLPAIADKARQLIKQAYNEGIKVLITQGLRTIKEQNDLYKKGRRGIPGEKIVTNARGGYSYHNFGLAFDIAIIKGNGKVSWAVDDDWKRVVAIAKSLGLEWGGDWRSFKDTPHFQLTYGLSLVDLRTGKKPPIQVKKAVKAAKSNAVIWDGMELKKGQIGRLKVLKPINLWKREGEKLKMVRILKPGEVYRVYSYDNKHGGQYGVGAGLYVTNMNGYIKYETPSKAMLNRVNNSGNA